MPQSHQYSSVNELFFLTLEKKLTHVQQTHTKRENGKCELHQTKIAPTTSRDYLKCDLKAIYTLDLMNL